MKRYDTYKPSGIEWLGDIPAHWEVKRVKDIFQQINDSSSDIKENTYVPLENIESFYGRLIKRTSNENGEITTLFKKGDILLNKLRPYLAKVLLADFDGGVSGEVIVYRINTKYRSKINNGYYFYRFLSQEFISKINSITDGVKMPRSNPNKIFALDIQFPTQSEQTTIATYLDTKTAAIDRKIELLTAKADKYKALRRSLINETVCRGLNPNAPLKNSGIEWIGRIPEHWEVKRVKEIFYIGRGRVIGQDELVDKGKYPVYSSQTENNGCLGYIDTFDFNATLLTWTTDGANAGTLFRRDGKFNCTNVCGTLKPQKRKENLDFVLYVLQIAAKHNKRIDTNGAKIMNNEMSVIVLLYPPIEEQSAIAQYLNEKTAQIDTILTNISEQIGKLTQLRKTLINDVVTGKIKVTE